MVDAPLSPLRHRPPTFRPRPQTSGVNMLLDDYSGAFDPDFDLHAVVAARAGRARTRVVAARPPARPRRACRSCTPTGRARRCRTSRSRSGWRRARSTRGACSARSTSADGDVPTILKNIQLDIGAPHHFMDFRCRVDDAEHGEFWLAHCGALMDVEPMGEEYVRGCATPSRTRRSTRRRWRPTRGRRCDRCTAHPGDPPTGSRTATGRSRSSPTPSPCSHTRTSRSSNSR